MLDILWLEGQEETMDKGPEVQRFPSITKNSEVTLYKDASTKQCRLIAATGVIELKQQSQVAT